MGWFASFSRRISGTDLYYEKIKVLMNNYQDLILENQMVLDELEQECQEKINENMAYALQYMDAYDYRMNLGKLKIKNVR